MSGESWTINSDHTEAAFIRHVKTLREQHKYITFSAPRVGADRSLSVNALSHVWYSFCDKMLSEPVGTARNFCKLHFGVPLLRGEDEKFRAAYDQVIKPLGYPQKLSIMTYWPVTSLMSREQMTRYLDAVQMHYAESHGLVLESRGEYAALKRKSV